MLNESASSGRGAEESADERSWTCSGGRGSYRSQALIVVASRNLSDSERWEKVDRGTDRAGGRGKGGKEERRTGEGGEESRGRRRGEQGEEERGFGWNGETCRWEEAGKRANDLRGKEEGRRRERGRGGREDEDEDEHSSADLAA
eukprot:763815-Hanusia_phi.AAC.2